MFIRRSLSRPMILVILPCLLLLVFGLSVSANSSGSVDAGAATTPTDFDCESINDEVGLEDYDIPLEECEALKALYDYTSGDSWTRRTNWLDPDPCDWEGVHCLTTTKTGEFDRASRYVDRLSLVGNHLIGLIPSELSDLTYLSSLDLSYNSLRTPDDAALIEFLDTRQPDWEATQTVSPANVESQVQPDATVLLSWDPIAYQEDGGYYEVLYFDGPGDDLKVLGRTEDKSAEGYRTVSLPAGAYYFVVLTFTPAHVEEIGGVSTEIEELRGEIAEGVNATITASIEITKSPTWQIVRVGGTATFDLQVQNTGNVSLTNVNVEDSHSNACNRQDWNLAPGEVQEYACAAEGIEEGFGGEASVSGQPPVGNPVEDKDKATVYVVAIDLSQQKSAESVGLTHEVTATAKYSDPLYGWFSLKREGLTFGVNGANSVQNIVTTDESGGATFAYTGTKNEAQEDIITAWLDLNGSQTLDANEPSGSLKVTWLPISLTYKVTAEGTEQEALRTVRATVMNSLGVGVAGLDVFLTVTKQGSLPEKVKSTTDSNGEAVLEYISSTLPVPHLASTPLTGNRCLDAPLMAQATTELIEVWVDLNRNEEYELGEPYGGIEVPTAITLVSFTANPDLEGMVTLQWTTAVEYDNAGFNIYRAISPDGPYTQINDQLIPGKGTGLHTGGSYSYLDLPPGIGDYFYQLEDVDTDGIGTLYPRVKVHLAEATSLYLPYICR